MLTRLLLIFVSCILSLPQELFAIDINTIRAEWKAVLDRQIDYSVEYLTQSLVKHGGKSASQETKIVAKRFGSNMLAYFGKDPKSVSVSNDQYFFVVNQSHSGEWTLEAYGDLSDEKIKRPLKRLKAFANVTHQMYSLGEIDLYTNLDAFRVDKETEDTVSLVSTRNLASNTLNKIRLSDIRLTLDKKDHFRLREATCSQEINNSLCKVRFEFVTDSSTAHSLDSTISWIEEYEKEQIRIESTTHYKFLFDEKMKASDFRMSAYGLPEPVGAVWESPTPAYIWLFTAAGGFGGLALLFRWIAKRRT